MTTAEFIAKWEGLRLEPYHDVAGYPTIGVGHKLSDEKHADLSQWPSITREQALAQLDEHLAHFRAGVRAAYVWTGEVPEDRMTAMVSLAFNIGLGGFRGSKLLTMLNQESGYSNVWGARVSLEWLDWCKATINGRKQVVDGLLRRRRAEVALFFGVDAA